MLTTEYILNDIQALTLSNTIADAKLLFNDLVFTHIPVVDNGEFLGLISEDDLIVYNKDKTINEIRFSLQTFFVKDTMSWLELLKLFSINDTNILPVLNSKNKYLGYYEMADILQILTKTPFLQEEGNVLILAKNKFDFSMSQIVQIIESNEAKLYGIFISGYENQKAIITVKLYSDNINDVIHSFRRFEYDIILGVKEDEYINDLKQRSDYLKKYLSI